MRKTNVVKTLGIIILLLMFSLICSNKVQASEATLSVSNCNVGESFTVTVNIPSDIVGYEGNLSITYSNGTKVSLDKMLASPSPSSLSYTGNYTGTFKADVAGQATVSVSNLKMYSAASFDNLTSIDADFSPVNSTSTLMQNITISNPAAAPAAPANEQPANNQPASTTSTPAPAPVTLTFKDINEKMYTNRRVNVRQSYGTDSNIIQTLAPGTEVTRTGISNGNKDGYSWSRVSYNGVTGYLITGALTSDAPATEEPEENPEEQPEENTEEILEDDKLTIQEIAEELGAIPEVGVNIMPFMFLGSCVACSVLMIEVKRKLA